MGKLRIIIFYLMIPIVIICLGVGIVYYREMGLGESERILCSVDNTVRIFLARPTIQPFLAFRSINENYTEFERFMTYTYSVLVIVAPILMTTAILAGFRAYIFDFLNSLKISFRKKMFIIGDGQTAKVIASKYAREYNVFYLMPAETTNEERVSLLKEKVKAYNVDYMKICDTCKLAKMEKASYVVLNFSDWFASYKTVTDIVEYLVKNNTGVSMPVGIVDSPGALRNAFNLMYQGFCNKYGKDNSALSFLNINVNDTNSQSFFMDPHMTQQPDGRHHIVFVGVGGYGRAMLRELVNYMISNDLTGTIELFDRSVESSINNLMYAPQNTANAGRFSVVPNAVNAEYSTSLKTDAGSIDLNFYRVNIGELKATSYMGGILSKDRATEFFCCIADLETCFECYRMIEAFGDDFADTKLYFRVEPKHINAFKAMQLNSPGLEFLPDDFPDIELIRESQK